MQLVFVALGANLGSPSQALQNALSALRSCSRITALRCSSFYRTSPVSPIPQPYYLNAVCSFYTDYTPLLLLEFLQTLERQAGQLPKVNSMLPRYLDLDLLFYGSQEMQTKVLTLPHPRWQERLFVLIPLRDLTPALTLPNGQIVPLDAMIAPLQELKKEEVIFDAP